MRNGEEKNEKPRKRLRERLSKPRRIRGRKRKRHDCVKRGRIGLLLTLKKRNHKFFKLSQRLLKLQTI